MRIKFFMKQEKIEKENGTFVKHFCPRCGNFVVETSEGYLYKKDGTPSKRAFDYLIWNFEDHIENDECKEFLQKAGLSDLPEHLKASGFKNIFVIDEESDFSKR